MNHYIWDLEGRATRIFTEMGQYWFISSGGKISSQTIGKRMTDSHIFRFKSKNMYRSQEDAERTYKQIMSHSLHQENQ